MRNEKFKTTHWKLDTRKEILAAEQKRDEKSSTDGNARDAQPTRRLGTAA